MLKIHLKLILEVHMRGTKKKRNIITNTIFSPKKNSILLNNFSITVVKLMSC